MVVQYGTRLYQTGSINLQSFLDGEADPERSDTVILVVGDNLDLTGR
jgi:hypothetical protein